MAKNYFGVVLTTKEHDKYRLVVYRYKDPGILNTCPMCQLLRAIHKFQQEYTEIHREHCSRIPPRKWYELGRLTPPTIEIVGFLGGGCKAHHHAACQVASYAVSHKKPRVWLSMSIQPLQVDQHTCLRSQLFECILL